MNNLRILLIILLVSGCATAPLDLSRHRPQLPDYCAKVVFHDWCEISCAFRVKRWIHPDDLYTDSGGQKTERQLCKERWR